ncbi:unnamed protein product [Spirodela intermedia]|uniref:RRM domain-containing protein n=1 Tax=Spirodela intermedia TaxID=51605 RepID=A0A7I8JQL8_SPIIN|nr:unnamed protein product [Spirodela intermedia]CAA6672436.1 unnamed protein product [Spirodela intermedia]
MGSKSKEDARNREKDGASPGKIFVGGLAKDTSLATYAKHFGKYGEMTDYVIMKDKFTNQPRGFGFVTYADPSVVDKVIEDAHVINGKQNRALYLPGGNQRTIPKDPSSKDFKTKKIFVGGLPPTYTEDELKGFFSTYGKVVDHQIIRDHHSNRSRGFGFVIFDSEQSVDDLLSNGHMIEIAGAQVEIKKAEPKKSSKQPSGYGSNSRAHSFGEGPGGYGSSYSGYGGDEYGPPPPYRTPGGFGSRFGGGYGGGYGGSYGGGGAGETSLGYSGRYGGGYGGAYGGGYGGGIGGYRRDEGFGGAGDGDGAYEGSSYGSGYNSRPGAGGYGFGPLYGGGRGAYGSSSTARYHPYGR